MRYVMKTKHDNDLTDCIAEVYVKNYTELLRLIGSSAIYRKIRQNNDVIDLISAVYVENEFELSWPTRPGMICDENQTGQ